MTPTSHRRHVRVFASAIAILILSLPQAAGAATSPTPASGAASGVSTLFALSAGSQSVQTGLDRTTSTTGAVYSAQASTDLIVSAGRVVSGGSRTATSPESSGSTTLGAGPRTVDGAAALSLVAGTITALSAPAGVLSSVDLSFGQMNLTRGLAVVDSARTTTRASVDGSRSSVARTVRIGAVHVLPIAALFRRLGIDATALTCDAVATAGAALNLATTDACAKVAAITSAIDSAKALLDTASAVMQADLATVNALPILGLVDQALVDLASRYNQDLAALLGLPLPTSQKDALVAEITRRRDATSGGSTLLNGATCSMAIDAIVDVQNAVAPLAAPLAAATTQINTACGALQSVLDLLTGATLLNIGGLTISSTAIAAPHASLGMITGTVNGIRVGNHVIASGSLSAASAPLTAAIGAARTQAATVLNGLGLGNFAVPEIELLAGHASSGSDANGWFSIVRANALHVGLGAMTVTLPAAPASIGSVLAARPAKAGSSRLKAAATATVPALAIDAAVFQADARFHAAIAGTSDGNPLPVTGVATTALLWMGAGLLIGAAGLRKLVLAGR